MFCGIVLTKQLDNLELLKNDVIYKFYVPNYAQEQKIIYYFKVKKESKTNESINEKEE